MWKLRKTNHIIIIEDYLEDISKMTCYCLTLHKVQTKQYSRNNIEQNIQEGH